MALKPPQRPEGWSPCERDASRLAALLPRADRRQTAALHSEGSTVKELARALSLSEARASRLADELTVSGHVLSDRNPSDRRQVRLQATPVGASKANLVFGQRLRALEAGLNGVSEQDMDAFMLVLDRIVVQIEALAERASAAVENVPAR